MKADLDEVAVAAVAAGAKNVDAGAVVIQVGDAVANASVPVVARGHHTSAVFHAVRCVAQNVTPPWPVSSGEITAVFVLQTKGS